jgi:lipoprotein-anchoring transpeptidase ErfK/SrfK
VRRAVTLSVTALASVAVLASAGIGLSQAGSAPHAQALSHAGALSHLGVSSHAGPASHAGASSKARAARLSKPAGAPRTAAKPGATAKPGAATLSLTAAERRSCPKAAAACVDLATHVTWLQSRGKVTFGPVRMQPGPPGTPNATPRGTFHVQWKAGADYISDEYNEAMPWATFFAPGGIAFHGGSLTKASHGCVHLTVANAHYFHNYLPIGAEVVVF